MTPEFALGVSVHIAVMELRLVGRNERADDLRDSFGRYLTALHGSPRPPEHERLAKLCDRQAEMAEDLAAFGSTAANTIADDWRTIAAIVRESQPARSPEQGEDLELPAMLGEPEPLL